MPPATGGDVAHIARAVRVLSSPTRLRILSCLLTGEATVSDLAVRLDIEPHLVSRHLKVLRVSRLVSASIWGRLYSYRLDADRIRSILAALQRLPHLRPGRAPAAALHEALSRKTDLRLARMCYDHLAGGAGVYLLGELLRRKWLVQRREGRRSWYELSARGAQALVQRRVNVFRARRARRVFAYGCADWSPRRRHLGGALGAAILDAMIRAEVLRRQGRSRQLVLLRPIVSWLTHS